MSGATQPAARRAGQGSGPREGQTFAGTSRLVRYANFVKLPHTLFALPFALVGVVLGTFRTDVTVPTVGWVVLAFTAARFAAMGFNRIADRHFDARNPRTAMREIPAGTMGVGEAWVSIVVASLLFEVAAWRINTLCLELSLVALAWVFFYSYTKRFTRWSHLVLGAGLAIAPVGGFLAVTGSWPDPWWMLVALALAVTTWTAGFDILYALQDIDIDRREGLRSLPAAIGTRAALGVARGLHVVTIVALAAVGYAMHTGVYYGIGTMVAMFLLAWEHYEVRGGDLSTVDKAFFRINMLLSSVFFVFVLLERLMPYHPLGTPW